MRNIVGEIRLSLHHNEEYYKTHKELLLTDFPCEIDLSKGVLPIPKETEIFIFGKSGYCDVPIETSFDVIYPGRNILDYVFVKSTLKYVSVNPRYEINYLPNGYSGLCLLEFPEGIPDILNKLGTSREKTDFSIHDFLWLTQKPVLERMLEELGSNVSDVSSVPSC
jgi:hypothetical protein